MDEPKDPRKELPSLCEQADDFRAREREANQAIIDRMDRDKWDFLKSLGDAPEAEAPEPTASASGETPRFDSPEDRAAAEQEDADLAAFFHAVPEFQAFEGGPRIEIQHDRFGIDVDWKTLFRSRDFRDLKPLQPKDFFQRGAHRRPEGMNGNPLVPGSYASRVAEKSRERFATIEGQARRNFVVGMALSPEAWATLQGMAEPFNAGAPSGVRFDSQTAGAFLGVPMEIDERLQPRQFEVFYNADAWREFIRDADAYRKDPGLWRADTIRDLVTFGARAEWFADSTPGQLRGALRTAQALADAGPVSYIPTRYSAATPDPWNDPLRVVFTSPDITPPRQRPLAMPPPE